jgi:uncharacterized membrane protein YfcA
MDHTTAYVMLVVFVATLIRSTFGFGEALVAVPLLALTLPIEFGRPSGGSPVDHDCRGSCRPGLEERSRC